MAWHDARALRSAAPESSLCAALLKAGAAASARELAAALAGGETQSEAEATTDSLRPPFAPSSASAAEMIDGSSTAVR
ncbi:hypothetical protein T492DRAFT_910924 [Pavlovales sp. CCMP2436]|nr:hypothetical protein T492DRAFT_910924 [Pavlovales sp. CCMP2436]